MRLAGLQKKSWTPMVLPSTEVLGRQPRFGPEDHLNMILSLSDLSNPSIQQRLDVIRQNSLRYPGGNRQYANWVDDDIFYRLQRGKNKETGKYAPVEYVGNPNVPMGDWDWPDKIHDSRSISIENLGNVVDNLRRETTQDPNALWRLYMTPGGVRGFNVGERMTPGEMHNRGVFDRLQIDKLYHENAVMPQYTLPGYPRNAFHARISEKPGRPDDFVAYYLTDVGQGMPVPKSMRYIEKYHDIPIAHNVAQQGMATALPQSGIELLEQQLKTIEDNIIERETRGRLELAIKQLGGL
jgi:hypothetical protein